jgi:hypothetical protein
MQGEERCRGRIEKVERRAWARVDLDQPGGVAFDEKIGAVQATQTEMPGKIFRIRAKPALQPRPDAGRAHGASKAERRLARRVVPLRAETEGQGVLSIGEEQERDCSSRHLPLKIEALAVLGFCRLPLREPHMRPASPTDAFAKPTRRIGGRRRAYGRMRDAKVMTERREGKRVLGA